MSMMTSRAAATRWLTTALLGGAVALNGCSNDIQKMGPSPQEDAIATKACQLTTQVLERSDVAGYHECIKVELDRKVTDTFYQAHAILDNGADQPMGIRVTNKETQDITIVLRNTSW